MLFGTERRGEKLRNGGVNFAIRHSLKSKFSSFSSPMKLSVCLYACSAINALPKVFEMQIYSFKSEAFFPPCENNVKETAGGFHIELTRWKVEGVVVRLVDGWMWP